MGCTSRVAWKIPGVIAGGIIGYLGMDFTFLELGGCGFGFKDDTAYTPNQLFFWVSFCSLFLRSVSSLEFLFQISLQSSSYLCCMHHNLNHVRWQQQPSCISILFLFHFRVC
ncbi:hypothetical protein GGR53DRAFT_500836, partial [Hypoxylon sp. FL1150]